jgi:hypothetical protein
MPPAQMKILGSYVQVSRVDHGGTMNIRTFTPDDYQAIVDIHNCEPTAHT